MDCCYGKKEDYLEMRSVNRKESWLVLCIFVAVCTILGLVASSYADIIKETPSAPTTLAESDFVVSSQAGNIVIGKSTRDDVIKVYPQGHDLGKSNIYRPLDVDCLLSFTKVENILVRIDIGPGELSTARGIKVGDSFSTVVDKYGSNYTRAYDKETPGIFDAYYGTDNYVLFKVEDDRVNKIYIGRPLS